jgi:hypothetical protein
MEQKVEKFLSETSAFKNAIDKHLKTIKEKLISNEWKVYRFNARVKNDDGFEMDTPPDNFTIESFGILHRFNECKTFEESKKLYEKLDVISIDKIFAMYCWSGIDEYCITNDKYILSVVQTYKDKCECVFPI